MKKNNYYVGLLAGVLTASVLQGSDGKENMPGLGGNQTQRQNKSSQSENNTGITEELKTAASELAATYDERAEGSQNERKKEEFRAKAEALRKKFEVKNAEEFLVAKDMVEVKEIRYRYASELAEYYKRKGNNAFARSLKNDFAHLDNYNELITSQKFENNDDFRNFQVSKTRLGYTTFINNAPIRHMGDAKLYPTLRTQQIFGSEDYIVPGMYQYIITYPVTKKEIEAWVAQLKNNYDDRAIKARNYNYGLIKPIIFQAQKFDTLTIKPVPENQYFEIKSYWCDISTKDNRKPSAGDYYKRLEKYKKENNKPIIFGKTEKDLELGIGININYYANAVSYQEYLELVNKYDDNFFVEFVDLNPTSTEELQQQLGVLIKSKNVNQIRIDSEIHVDVANIPLAHLGCVKIREMSFANYQNLNGELFLIRTMVGNINNVQCKTIYCFEGPYPGQNTSVNRVYDRIAGGNVYELNSQRIYIDKIPSDVNERLCEMEKAYLQYIKAHDLEYLSGYVNVENKPAELSDDEWRKVIILKGKAEEIKMLMRYDNVPKEIIYIDNSIDEVIAAAINLSEGNERHISNELTTRGLQIQDVTGDGNCGIYALLAGLNPNQAGNYQSVRQDSQEWRNAETLRQTLFGNDNALGQMVDNLGNQEQLNRWLALDNNEALQAVNTYVRSQGRSSLIILDTTVTAESGVAFTVVGAKGEQIHYNTLDKALRSGGDNPLMLVYTPNHWKAVVPSNK